MDFETSLKILVSKKGLPYALEILSSPNLPKDIKQSLSKKRYFINGVPNVKLISSLV